MDELSALQGADLISLAWDDRKFDIRALAPSGEVFQAYLSNSDHTPIDVQVHWTAFRIVFDETRASLGEIETITIMDGVVDIEMDAGRFSVTANRRFFQRLSGPASDA